MMTLGSFSLPKEDLKNIYISHDTPLEFYWHQHFFTENQQILLYQEIQVYIALEHIISNAFNFFNKQSWNFDDASKIGLL